MLTATSGILLASVALLILQVENCDGHARLLDPVSRASLWRVRPGAPKNEDDDSLGCGGFDVLHGRNKGKCGVCGDPFQLNTPRPHEFGGTFGRGGVVKTYKKGQRIVLMFEVVVDHGGRVQFKLCPAPESGEVSQDCLDAYSLQIINGKKSSAFFQVKKKGMERITVQLPENLVCKRCVLQYSYIGGDRKGTCANGKKKAGCGPQPLYRGCSDIAIRASRRKRQTCFGVGVNIRTPGIDVWCTENCQIGYCPPSHCECVPLPEDNELE